MLARLMDLVGGYAMRRRDLRLLYIAVFLSFLGASITFPLRLLYAQAHHASPAQLGLMAAAFLLAPLLAQLPMGWLVDHWGRVPVLLVGLVSHTLISLLYIPFNAPGELVALRFAEGVSVSAFQPSVSAYIADVTPEEQRSEAYGVLNATLSGGMLIGPLIGGVVGQSYGFTMAFIANVAVEVLAVAVVWGRVREPAIHRAARGSGEGAPVRFAWRRLISVPLVGAYVAFFCAQVVMGVLSAVWTIWIRDLGGSYAFIGATFTVFALPQIIFGAMAGRLGDRWGRAPVLLVAGVLIGGVYVVYGLTTSLVLIMALGVVEGLFLVFQQPAAQGLLADASPSEARGRAQGLAGAIGAIGGAASAFVSLPLYHAARSAPFVLAGAFMIAGSLVAAACAVVMVRRRAAASPPATGAAAR